MNRICKSQPIVEAFAMIPPRIREMIACDWVTGSDPIFIGLHNFAKATYGRSYRETAHACTEGHTIDKRRTIVLPADVDPNTVVHELGHVLDEAIRWRRHTPAPVSWYAKTDSFEAFAEAFTLWIDPVGCAKNGSYRPDVLDQDKRTLALFEELAA